MLDSRFPRAVPGEHYDRYVRSVWPQAERWLARSAHAISHVAKDAPEAREVLCALAARDLERRLHSLEELLIGELLRRSWSGSECVADAIEPEIPEFLIA